MAGVTLQLEACGALTTGGRPDVWLYCGDGGDPGVEGSAVALSSMRSAGPRPGRTTATRRNSSVASTGPPPTASGVPMQ